MSARVEIPRRNSLPVRVGDLVIGGESSVSVQSMTKTDTRDADSTIAQILSLAKAGCELIRCAVPDYKAAEALKEIVKASPIPVAADIHFDPDLALAALKAGVNKLRINPGTIGDRGRLERVVRTADDQEVPIRVGVNAGSLEREYLERDGLPSPQGMADSALAHVRLLEEMGFHRIVISLKASDAPRTIAAYRLLAGRCDYPLHIGVSEAGGGEQALIKSSVGIGALLAEGIGDTVRVSLTGNPLREVEAAYGILQSLGLRRRMPEFISCPTCGRCEVDLTAIAAEVERRLKDLPAPLTIAVMGCAVNSPGEAREADIGFAGGGKGQGVIFKNGKPFKTVTQEEAVEELVALAREMCSGPSRT
jgi:(E)-4-hydroxy-3-methylbut-2-enyl-diphosphate synthase